MKLSLKIIPFFLVAFIVAGCGAPVSEFTSSEDTNSLDRKAQDAVEQAILHHFGTPSELVAWTELPIDFGTIHGKVLNGSEANSHRFEVELTSDTEDLSSLTANDILGLALQWKSGKYESATFLDNNQEESAANFQVTGYVYDKKANTKTLYLNANLESPLEAGDEFQLIGHKLAQGHKLYRQHCVHCHGASGDGNGPTAEYLNPRPRDYRRGIIKFDSTSRIEPPSRADLANIISKGIPGTYMPSFLLENLEREKIIEYIRFLAMRGELERRLFNGMKDDFTKEVIKDRISKDESQSEIDEELDLYLAEDFPDRITSQLAQMANAWNIVEQPGRVVNPTTPRVLPQDDPESIPRGRALFLSGKSKCVSCHGVQGRGDGPNVYSYQDITDQPGKKYQEMGVFDDWGNKIKPRDLTQGIYRGGRRPLDLYRRIHTGIKGTPMTAFGTALTEREIWDIVNYVMSIPFQKSSDNATVTKHVTAH